MALLTAVFSFFRTTAIGACDSGTRDNSLHRTGVSRARRMSSVVISAATEAATILRATLSSDFRHDGLVGRHIVRRIVVIRIIGCSSTADGSICTVGLLIPVTPATTTSVAFSQLQDI